MSYLLQDTTFWAFVGLVLFFIVIFVFGAPKMITKSLDDRADRIRTELDEARRLREEAQELLASYKRKQAEAAKNAEDIIRQAKAEADYLRENAKTEIAQRIGSAGTSTSSTGIIRPHVTSASPTHAQRQPNVSIR